MKKTFIFTNILLIMLAIRFIVQGFLSFQNFIFLLSAGLYFIAFLGVLLKKRWGVILVGVIVIIDIILSAVFAAGAKGFGAVVYDLILGFMAYKEYRKFFAHN